MLLTKFTPPRFTFATMKRTLPILFALFPLLVGAQEITGDWYGVLNAMGTELPMVLHISQHEDGSLSGTMDSPDQNVFGLEIDELSLNGQSFHFKMIDLQAEYQGTLSTLGLRGDFTQAGYDFPMDFTQTPVTRSGLKARPQDPQSFPYQQETVSFPGGDEEVSLTGEFTWPSEGTPKAALVLVSGSGGQDRNSELGQGINHRPFLVLSDFLTRAGYAVLRYDDRGIAQSTGDHNLATSADFALDATAAAQYLRTRPELEGVKIGLAGHSEGGLIGPMVFAQDEEALDFLVLLAAPGLAGDSIILEQSRRIQELMGAPPVLVERNLAPLRTAYNYIRNHPEQNTEEIDAGLLEIFMASIDDLPLPLQNSIVDREAFARQQMGNLSNPWLRYFLSTDPAEFLQKVTIPVLALNGELDQQVVAEDNLTAIAMAVGSNGNTDITIVNLPGLNHLFQKATTGAPAEYGTIEETFNPTAMRIITSWLDQLVGQ